MRIIGGKHKGRKLKEFDINCVRPTSDRAREALFNILSFDISGAAFLDVFCGTGAIGLEAVSRGAEVTFVDSDKRSVKLVKDNLALISESANVVFESAEEFFKRNKTAFDIIFLDPPYNYDNYKGLTELISASGALKKGGKLIVERTAKIKPEYYGVFTVKDERKYGLNAFDFLAQN